MGLTSGGSCGRRRHAVFHSASLRKKPHRANRSARPAPTSCCHGPCTGRCLIISILSDFALAPAVLGLHPAGARRGRLYITIVMQTSPSAKPHPAALTRGRPSRVFVVPSQPSGMRDLSRCIPPRPPPPLRLRLRSGGSHPESQNRTVLSRQMTHGSTNVGVTPLAAC